MGKRTLRPVPDLRVLEEKRGFGRRQRGVVAVAKDRLGELAGCKHHIINIVIIEIIVIVIVIR
jgi:hypothetical protein